MNSHLLLEVQLHMDTYTRRHHIKPKGTYSKGTTT